MAAPLVVPAAARAQPVVADLLLPLDDRAACSRRCVARTVRAALDQIIGPAAIARAPTRMGADGAGARGADTQRRESEPAQAGTWARSPSLGLPPNNAEPKSAEPRAKRRIRMPLWRRLQVSAAAGVGFFGRGPL